jgi:hypothetical protein
MDAEGHVAECAARGACEPLGGGPTMGTNGPLRLHRVCVRITAIHYIEVDAVNAQHAEGQARLKAIVAYGLPSGTVSRRLRET